MALTKASEERLNDLLPFAQDVLREFLLLCHQNGYNVQITSGFRTIEEQNALFKKPQKVTNAKGGQSMHNYRIAIDVVLIDDKGKADWNPVKYGELWKLALKAGLHKKGLTWAGNWKGFSELVHFDVSSGKTWQEIAKLYPYETEKKALA